MHEFLIERSLNLQCTKVLKNIFEFEIFFQKPPPHRNSLNASAMASDVTVNEASLSWPFFLYDIVKNAKKREKKKSSKQQMHIELWKWREDDTSLIIKIHTSAEMWTDERCYVRLCVWMCVYVCVYFSRIAIAIFFIEKYSCQLVVFFSYSFSLWLSLSLLAHI